MIVFLYKRKIQYAINDLLEAKAEVEHRDRLEAAVKDMWDIEYKENETVDELYDVLYCGKECSEEMRDLVKRLMVYLIVFQKDLNSINRRSKEYGR